MQIDIKYRPSYSLAILSLIPNESVRVDSGAMVSMSADISIETKAQGGIMSSLTRSFLGGESFFQNTFKAGGRGGEITLAPPLPGDISMMELHGETLLLQSGAYIASSEGIILDTKWTGGKTFFAREGLFMLRTSGNGTLIFASYGAIHEKILQAGEKYRVDTGHIVAFSDGMGFTIQRIGGWKSTILSGEGLIVELTGPGKVLIQTRSEDAFLSWLIPKIPTRNEG